MSFIRRRGEREGLGERGGGWNWGLVVYELGIYASAEEVRVGERRWGL